MSDEDEIAALRRFLDSLTPREHFRAMIIAAQQPGQDAAVEFVRSVIRMVADNAPLPDLISLARALLEIVEESTLP